MQGGLLLSSLETKFTLVSVSSHKLNMDLGSLCAITALPFQQFAQIHIKLRYVFRVWHLHTFSVVEMRVALLNINAGPDARLAAGIYLNLLQQV